MFLNFVNAKYIVLIGCVLVGLTYAKQGQKRICDTGLMISSDYDSSQAANTDANGNIHKRSLSAWTWIPKFSSHTIPQVIFEAECLSEYCSYPSTGVDERLNSLPIYQDILVLKQDKQNRKCFRAISERVIVGCTCVWAKAS
ncbi:interleukin-17A-like [Myxocyprinus asiaticus]|uniref:interleukin-17A-like n=1 Tax=Myxocyprinus asiaticus TaxID=70543 RepID=UPI0022213AD6|nr:interleukin-17A-like [Myxocyprinus asiaticus]